MAPRTRRARGSRKLAGAAVSGRQLSAVEMSKLVALSKRSGVKIVDWWVAGQPTPDAVSGSFQTNPRVAVAVLRDLMGLKGLRPNIEVFPYGIPVPRNVIVRFTAGGRAR